MSSYIEVHLNNFRFWVDKTFRMELGVNLITGNSGSGKSTLCKAIYFVLFGGRKHTDLENWNHIGRGTVVTFHFVSDKMQYKIIRSRPHETLTVQILTNGENIELKSHTAQAWIHNQFGIEDKWLASAYVSMKKPHFLLGASNSDKMSLLQQITFGDVSPKNQPETYLNAIKPTISTFQGQINIIDNDIRMNNGIIENIISRNPNIMAYGTINDEDLKTVISDNESVKEKLLKLKDDYTSILSRRHIESKISEIKVITITLDEVEIKISELKLLKELVYLRGEMKYFNKDVINVDSKVIKNDKYLYEKYISNGWDKLEDINDYISKELNKTKKYEEQLDIIKRNDELEITNNRAIELNKNFKNIYLNKLDEYNKYISTLNHYNLSLENTIKKIEKCKIVTIDSFDDLSVSYLENLVDIIKYNSYIIGIKDKLKDFDTDILNISKDELDRCNYLYHKYIENGYDINCDIKEFLILNSNLYEAYKLNEENKKKNSDILVSNLRVNKMNTDLKNVFDNKSNEYSEYLFRFNKNKNDIIDVNKLIDGCHIAKNDEPDDLSVSYLERLHLINKHNLYIMGLKDKLHDFNMNSIDINKDVLDKCNYLYHLYISNGYDINDNIEEFLSDRRDSFEDYKLNEEHKQKNLPLMDKNNRIDRNNHRNWSDHKDIIDKNKLNNDSLDCYNVKLNECHKLLNDIKITKISEDDDLSIEYLNKINKILISNKNIEDLKCVLIGFKEKVLTLDKNYIIFLIELYKKYINYGYNITDDIEVFLKEQRNIYDEYVKNENNKKTNISIKENNKNKELLNQKIRKTYDNELNEYNIKKIKCDKYKSNLNTLNDNVNKLESLNKLCDNDDLSVEFVTKLLNDTSNSLNEMLCPHCNHGLIIENNKLHIGNIKNNDDKIRVIKLIDVYKIELEKRKYNNIQLNNLNEFNDKYSDDILQLDDNLLNVPILKDLFKYDNLFEIYQLDEPKLTSFDVPNYSYNDCRRFMNSFGIINIYQSYMDVKEKYVDIELFDVNLKDEETLRLQKQRILKDIDLYTEKISDTKLLIVEEPSEPEREDRKKLFKIYDIDEPKLTSFEIPEFTYVEYQNMSNSYNLISVYNEYQSIKDEYLTIEYNKESIDRQIIERSKLVKYANEKQVLKDVKNNKVDEPIEPEYIKLEEEITIKNIDEPTLTSFEIPKFSCDKYRSLLHSYLLIGINNEYNTIKDKFKTVENDDLSSIGEQIIERNNKLKYEEYYQSLLNKNIVVIDEPVENEYLKLDELIEIDDNLTPSKLNVFDNPVFDLKLFESYYRSYNKIDLYNKYLKLEDKLPEEVKNIVYDENDIIKYEELKTEIIETNANIKCLKDSLINLVEDDPNISNMIQYYTELIEYNNGKIISGNSQYEVNKIKLVLVETEKKRNEIVLYINSLTELYTYINQLGTNSLQDKINEVNDYLTIILNDLFDDSIDIKLSSHRTLKNGDQKLQINFNADYKGNKLKSTDSFSDGEEERISIALLMVFSRMNTNPILIIDEVLAGMHEELRMKCVEIIDRWSTGKFVIHICHSIVQGAHGNVVNV